MDLITATDAPILVGLIVLSITLVRIVETLITKKMSKRNGTSMNPGPSGLTAEEHDALVRLDISHAKYDSDGTPLWYVPRSWADTQEKITVMLLKMAETLNTISGTQKAIVRTLDRMDDVSRRVDLTAERH